MTLITQISDPVLWAILNNKWLAGGQVGWVTNDLTHYQVSFDTSDTVQFTSKTVRELIDSRSPKDSKAATYKDMEIG